MSETRIHSAFYYNNFIGESRHTWFKKFRNINNKEHTATTTDVKTKIIYLLLLYKKHWTFIIDDGEILTETSVSYIIIIIYYFRFNICRHECMLLIIYILLSHLQTFKF